MNIIPVIDIQHGIAVRGIAGDRQNYQPLKSIWTDSVDPVEVARVLWRTYRPKAIYIADLDAIAGREWNAEVYRQLTLEDIPIWLDAGIRNVEETSRLKDFAGVIIGLETIPTPDALRAIVTEVGQERAIFSLDLKHKKTLGTWGDDPFRIAVSAISIGIQRMILLDLARVGTGSGVGTEELALRIKSKYPHMKLILGGGIKAQSDIDDLERGGIDCVLIASALHDGKILPQS